MFRIEARGRARSSSVTLQHIARYSDVAWCDLDKDDLFRTLKLPISGKDLIGSFLLFEVANEVRGLDSWGDTGSKKLKFPSVGLG